ncbi:MAG: FG-GAP repeat domain-containing protein [Luteimonas sp.]
MAVLALGLLAGGASGATTLGTARIYPMTDSWPDAVAIGDFNGDGRKDVVMATTAYQTGFNPDADWRLYIYLQAADGTLAAPIRLQYATNDEEGDYVERGYRWRTAMEAADLDGDGVDDIVVGRRAGLSLVYGNRTATFSVRKVDNTTGAAPGDAFTVFDLDRDGRQDVVAMNDTSGSERYGVTVYFGDSTQAFSRQRYMATSSEGENELKQGDLNGDGLTDIAISWLQGLGNGVEVFLNDGHGWFLPGVYYPRAFNVYGTYTVSVGDFTGDGRDDMVAGGSSYDFDARGIYLYRQQADGTLAAPVQLSSGDIRDDSSIPDSSIAFDLNGDRREDLLLLRSGGGIGYFSQDNGWLAREVIFEGPYMTWGGKTPIAAGDVDGDHCADVAVANYNYGLVVWPGVDCAVERHGSRPLLWHPDSQGVRPTGAAPSPQPVAPAAHADGVRGQSLSPASDAPAPARRQLRAILPWLGGVGFLALLFGWWGWRLRYVP